MDKEYKKFTDRISLRLIVLENFDIVRRYLSVGNNEL